MEKQEEKIMKVLAVAYYDKEIEDLLNTSFRGHKACIIWVDPKKNYLETIKEKWDIVVIGATNVIEIIGIVARTKAANPDATLIIMNLFQKNAIVIS